MSITVGIQYIVLLVQLWFLYKAEQAWKEAINTWYEAIAELENTQRFCEQTKNIHVLKLSQELDGKTY